MKHYGQRSRLALALAFCGVTLQAQSSINIPFEAYTLPNGLTRRAVDRPHDADGRREHLVSRRLEERGAWTHRVRAPVRARDVHRIGSRAVRPARPAHRRRGRHEQRIDVERHHELLRNRPVELPRIDAVDRSRPDGISARLARSREAERAARHREERAAAAGRQPAVRARVRDLLEGDVPRVASVLLAGHRQHGRSVGGVGRRREELLPALLRAEQRVS